MNISLRIAFFLPEHDKKKRLSFLYTIAYLYGIIMHNSESIGIMP